MHELKQPSRARHQRHGSPAARRKQAGKRHGLAGFMFTAPFMVLFLALFIAPLIYALYLSLYREQLVGGNAFVGLDNYTEGLKDKAFTDGVKRVALFMVVQVPIMLILALVVRADHRLGQGHLRASCTASGSSCPTPCRR